MLLTLLAGALGAGCAASPPSSFYTLTALPEVRARTSGIEGGVLALGIGPVVFPQFLDRPQIVTRAGDNRLGVEEFRRWGGTVQDDFLRVWGENLSHLLGTSRILVFPSESRMPLDFRITAEVLTFEGLPEGAAMLRVRWAVMDSDLEQTLVSREDTYRCPFGPSASAPTPPGADGPEPGVGEAGALVAALSQCLGDFSRDVAAVVGALPRLPPAVSVAPL